MRTFVRWAVGVIVIIHGLIHLLGVVKGFGWAEVSSLTQPIGTAGGIAWLAASLLVVACGGLLLAGQRWCWAVAAVAALFSQAVILTSWSDAKAGTLANVLLAIVAVHGYRSQGPASLRARFRRLARDTTASVLARTTPTTTTGPVTEADLAHLPAPVAQYVRACGAVGKPHILGFHATISGRIRGGPDQPWMPWTGEQVNTFGAEPSRVFFMDATMKGLPADVLHAYVGPTATMQVRVASLVTVVDARGPDMDRAETVTLLNDLCVLAASALIDAPIDWTPIDERHAKAVFSNAGHTVSAVITFNDNHELVDFVSDDRLRASADGRTFTRQRWSTPVGDHRGFGGRRVGASGRARWQPEAEPGFDYLDFHVDTIDYLERGDADQVNSARAPASDRPTAWEGAWLK